MRAIFRAAHNFCESLYAGNVAIAMLNIEDSDPNEESCFSSKINSQCKGAQTYIDDEAKDSFMSSATCDE